MTIEDDAPIPRGIWETTRQRLWADEWWQRSHPIADTARRLDTDDGVPIQGLAPVSLPVEPVREKPEARAEPVLELSYFTDDGAPIADLEIRAYDGFGFNQRVRTNANGHVRLPVQIDGPHKVELATIPDMSKIARVDPPVRRNVPPLRRDDMSPHIFGVGKPYDVVVARDRAELVSLDGWHEGGAVLLFGTARTQDEHAVTVRAILRMAIMRRKPNGMLLVLGHADTKGKKADNADLAKQRATSVLLYLAGARTDWAAHAFDNATVADLQSALAWAATTGIACDPGPVDDDWGPATASGLQGLRDYAGIHKMAQLGPDDWSAIYDLYDAELARLLYCDVETLHAIKGSLTLVGDSYGEEWPAVAPNKNGYLCPANRRVDLAWCDVHGEPLESFEEIYDGTYDVLALDVPPEAHVKIHCVNVDITPLLAAVVGVRIGGIEVDMLADETGLVEFTALCGEPIEVLRCTDLLGSCVLVRGIAADLASVKGAP